MDEDNSKDPGVPSKTVDQVSPKGLGADAMKIIAAEKAEREERTRRLREMRLACQAAGLGPSGSWGGPVRVAGPISDEDM